MGFSEIWTNSPRTPRVGHGEFIHQWRPVLMIYDFHRDTQKVAVDVTGVQPLLVSADRRFLFRTFRLWTLTTEIRQVSPTQPVQDKPNLSHPNIDGLSVPHHRDLLLHLLLHLLRKRPTNRNRAEGTRGNIPSKSTYQSLVMSRDNSVLGGLSTKDLETQTREPILGLG